MTTPTTPSPDGAPTDYRARDYASILAAMRALVPDKLPEWRDYATEADFGAVLLELFAYAGDILSYYQDRVADESLLGTARSRRSVIEHLRLIGYRFATAAPAAAVLSLSVPATTTDVVTVEPGDAFATTSGKDKPSMRFEYTGESPLRIDFNAVATDGGRKVFTGIPVEEGRLFADELLGVSDGSRDQRFKVVHPGVISRPPGAGGRPGRDVRLRTLTGTVSVEWLLQDTLAFSAADDLHFTIEIDADDQAVVVFGDGTSGAMPPPQAQILLTYRAGGGRAGNVAAAAITTIVDAPRLALLTAGVTNPAPATGGADRESIEHAVAHAPAVFRSLARAVTADDYEALARTFKGVGKVRALASGWNRVTLLVAPEGGGRVSDVLRLGLIAYFEDKRMLGHVVEIAEADPVPIVVTAEIGVDGYSVPEEVLAAAQQAGAALLAFDAIRFGMPVYLSAFYEKVQEVPGVVFVNILEFHRADEAIPAVAPSGLILLAPYELPVVPADPDHAGGIAVRLAGGGGP